MRLLITEIFIIFDDHYDEATGIIDTLQTIRLNFVPAADMTKLFGYTLLISKEAALALKDDDITRKKICEYIIRTLLQRSDYLWKKRQWTLEFEDKEQFIKILDSALKEFATTQKRWHGKIDYSSDVATITINRG